MSVKCVLLLLCYLLLLSGAVSEFTTTVYSIESSTECEQYNSLHDKQLMKILMETATRLHVPRTCASIHSANRSAPSGYYNITTTNGSTVQVYCDMKETNCEGEGGWTRVAYVNMTQPGATCPQGLNQTSYNNKSLCSNNGNGCTSTVFPTLVEYSKVCGRVRGYQYRVLVAFHSYNINTNLTIDDAYVDGVSITYGNSPRKHIWTYAAGPQDIAQDYGSYNCPCKQNSIAVTPPYVGTDYYCESGVYSCCPKPYLYNDPLWDGQQCGGGEVPCCTHPNIPWFIKTLKETTTEDIELRVCKVPFSSGDSPLELIEVFVQ